MTTLHHHQADIGAINDNEKGSSRSTNTSPGQQDHHQLPIDGLPLEPLAEVLRLTLPSTDPKALESDGVCSDYMRVLHNLRLVSKSWKRVIDTTPGLWALVSFGFPDHQNITNMHKSGNSPLIVHCSGITEGVDGIASCDRFLKLVEPARDRWRVIWLDSVLADSLPLYLSQPIPILETLHLHCSAPDPDLLQPLAIFGHPIPSIRHVDLERVMFPLSPSPFQGLRTFSLYAIQRNVVSVEWIMEVLKESPRLERLGLVYLDLQMPAVSKPVKPIDLVHLKSFEIKGVQASAIDFIVRRINAPNCTQFGLFFDGKGAINYDPSLLLDSALTLFEPVLQSLIQKMQNPHLAFGAHWFCWGRKPPPGSELALSPFFRLRVENIPSLSIISWIERVVDPIQSDGDLGERVGALRIRGRHTPLGDTGLTSRLTRLKSIAHITVDREEADVRRILQILGQAGPEPSFPSLRQLTLRNYRRNGQELLEMIRARFGSGSVQPPHLTVSFTRVTTTGSEFPDEDILIDPDFLRQIRAVEGVTVMFPDRAGPI